MLNKLQKLLLFLVCNIWDTQAVFWTLLNKENFASKLQATGDLYGDMFEISNFRKEDIANITDPSGEFVEVLQCHNASKGPQSRGHQYAGAFLYKVFTLYNV